MDSDAAFEGLAEAWLPDSPDHRVTSVVSFDPNHGARLQLLRGPAPPLRVDAAEPEAADESTVRTLYGLESVIDHILAGQPRHIPKLVGLLDGTPFVLLDGTLRLASDPANGPSLVEVTADAVLVGMPDGIGPTTFDRMVVSTHWLTELAAVGGLRRQVAWQEGPSGRVRYSATTEPVEEVQGTVQHADGPVIATLRLHPSQTTRRRMVTLAEDADLELRFPSPLPLARLREIWLPAVGDLVTLAAGRRDVADEVWLTREGLTDAERDERASVRLLARRRYQPAPLDERYMPGVDGRFRVGETELGDLLTRWLELQRTDGQAIR